MTKSKQFDNLQGAQPYEAPINVRQIANLPYGKCGCMADYYEPMALMRSDTNPDKSAMRLVVLLHDNPYEGTRFDVMPLAMELARRGLAVYTVGLSRPAADGSPYFLAQVGDVFEFLTDLAHDKHRVGLHCRTYQADGNKVILMGCGTGATLAALVLRMHFNARIREYVAKRCPSVRTYFSLGDSPSVVLDPLIRIEGFVSISGVLRLQEESNLRYYERWLGSAYNKTLLFTYLDTARYVSAEYPPFLLVTSEADPERKQALDVASSLPRDVSCRLLDYSREDEEGHLLSAQFSARYPLWTVSRNTNSTIVSICKEWGI